MSLENNLFCLFPDHDEIWKDSYKSLEEVRNIVRDYAEYIRVRKSDYVEIETTPDFVFGSYESNTELFDGNLDQVNLIEIVKTNMIKTINFTSYDNSRNPTYDAFLISVYLSKEDNKWYFF